MSKDQATFEILEDGTIKVTTGKIGPANHASADALLKYISELAGGQTVIEARPNQSQLHAHAHAETNAQH